jgi:hypothetical protein
MTTIILGGLLVLSVAAAFTFAMRASNYEEQLQELETDYNSLIDKYTDTFLQVTDLKIQVAKLKRKPRKDKGQPRKSYNGKPVTSKRKVQEGE